jgi:hypothetical protein
MQARRRGQYQPLRCRVNENFAIKFVKIKKKNAKVKTRISENLVDHQVKAFFVDTKRSRLPAHPHGSALSVFCGINAQGEIYAFSQTATDATDALYFELGFCVNLADTVC